MKKYEVFDIRRKNILIITAENRDKARSKYSKLTGFPFMGVRARLYKEQNNE